jgi:hypothetical protein
VLPCLSYRCPLYRNEINTENLPHSATPKHLCSSSVLECASRGSLAIGIPVNFNIWYQSGYGQRRPCRLHQLRCTAGARHPCHRGAEFCRLQRPTMDDVAVTRSSSSASWRRRRRHHAVPDAHVHQLPRMVVDDVCEHAGLGPLACRRAGGRRDHQVLRGPPSDRGHPPCRPT